MVFSTEHFAIRDDRGREGARAADTRLLPARAKEARKREAVGPSVIVTGWSGERSEDGRQRERESRVEADDMRD